MAAQRMHAYSARVGPWQRVLAERFNEAAVLRIDTLARPQRIRGAHEPLQKPAAQRRKPRLDEGLLFLRHVSVSAAQRRDGRDVHF